ncbi:MAG: DNA alkylation repair protein [Bacilli bacterium]|nr:DNA alkylation repair protein [Bacilli bacterium]
MDTVKSILSELEPLINETSKKVYFRQGIQEEVLGIKMGDLRKLAKRTGKNNELAWELWNTNIYELRILALSIFDGNALNENDLLSLITSTENKYLIDEYAFSLDSQRNDQMKRMDTWFKHDDPRVRQTAWNLAIVLNHSDQLSFEQRKTYVNRIEQELLDQDSNTQYAMNRLLCEIGIRYDDLTDRCIAIGEKLGLYREMKVAKGCTSPYAPAWIEAGRRNRKR